MLTSYTKFVGYDIMDVEELEVSMTLLKNIFMVFGILAFFGPLVSVFGFIVYLALRGIFLCLDKILKNDTLNRWGFGAFCTLCLVVIGHLIKSG